MIAEQTTVKVASCAPMLEGMKKVPARTSWAIASMIQASVKVIGNGVSEQIHFNKLIGLKTGNYSRKQICPLYLFNLAVDGLMLLMRDGPGFVTIYLGKSQRSLNTFLTST